MPAAFASGCETSVYGVRAWAAVVDSRRADLFPDQRDLKVHGPVFLGVEPAAIDVPGSSEGDATLLPQPTTARKGARPEATSARLVISLPKPSSAIDHAVDRRVGIDDLEVGDPLQSRVVELPDDSLVARELEGLRLVGGTPPWPGQLQMMVLPFAKRCRPAAKPS